MVRPTTLITVVNQASVSNITPSSCHRNPLLVPVFVQSRVHSPETDTLSDLEEKDKQHSGQAWPQARSTEAGWAVLSAKGNSHHPPTGMRARNPYFPQLLNGILRGRSLFLSRPLSWAWEETRDPGRPGDTGLEQPGQGTETPPSPSWCTRSWWGGGVSGGYTPENLTSHGPLTPAKRRL